MIAAAAGGVAAIVVVLILARIRRRPSPSATVRAYLQAIALGDASTANELLSPLDIGQQYLPDGLVDRTSFMSDAALGAATERIANPDIGLVSTSAGTDGAVVFVSYEIGGGRHETAITLRWRNGEWRMVTGLFQTLQIRPVFHAATGPAREVLHVTLGEARAGSGQIVIQTGSLIAYPGVYPLILEAPGWNVDERVEIPREVRLDTPHESVLVRARYVLPGGD